MDYRAKAFNAERNSDSASRKFPKAAKAFPIVMRLHIPWIVLQGLTMVRDRLLKFAALSRTTPDSFAMPTHVDSRRGLTAIALHRSINSASPPRLDVARRVRHARAHTDKAYGFEHDLIHAHPGTIPTKIHGGGETLPHNPHTILPAAVPHRHKPTQTHTQRIITGNEQQWTAPAFAVPEKDGQQCDEKNGREIRYRQVKVWLPLRDHRTRLVRPKKSPRYSHATVPARTRRERGSKENNP